MSRLEAAKRVVEQFIRHRPDDLIGLITFARYADTLSPLTTGHDALVEIVRGLAIQERPSEDGTGYGDALALACARLDQMGQWQPAAGSRAADPLAAVRSKVVVLLTDGENNCGLHLPEEAAGLAKKWGIRVYAISMKDDEAGSRGAEQKDDDDGLTDAEKLLRRLADETGGAYWKIGSAAQLQEVYERIDRLERSEIKTAIVYHAEISALFQYLALPALVLLLAERILSRHLAAGGRGGRPMNLGTPWMLLLLPLVALAGVAHGACAPLAARCGLPAERSRPAKPRPTRLGRRDWLTLAALGLHGPGPGPAAMEPASLRRGTPRTRSGHRPGRVAEHAGGRRFPEPA